MTTTLEQHGRERRPQEAVVRLQHADEHDPDPVERDLARRTRGGTTARGPASASRAPSPTSSAASGPASSASRRRERDEDGEGPAEHRGGDPVDVGAHAAGQRSGEHRDERAGERTARGDLEQHVRQGVRRRVGGADGPVADRAGLHQPAAEAEHPAQHGDGGDERRRPGETGDGAPRSAVTRRLTPAALTPDRQDRRRDGAVGVAGRRAAPLVELAQQRVVPAMTCVKLTRSLASVSPTTPASTSEPDRSRRVEDHRGTEQRADGVRAAVAEHVPAREVVRAGRRRSPRRRRRRGPRRDRRRARAAPAHSAAALSARPGRRSSRLARLAAAGDERPGGEHVGQPAAGGDGGPRAGPGRRERGGGEPGRADAEDLEAARRQPPVRERAEVPAQALGAVGRVLGEVVDEPERGAARGRDRGGRGGPEPARTRAARPRAARRRRRAPRAG